MSARLKTKGFTIVELLVVIVVLGILVTIGVVSYRGLTGDAFDKTVLSDADSLDGIVAHYGLRNDTGGKEWYSADGVDGDLDFVPSSGNVIDVVANNSDYCIRIYNPKSTVYDSLTNALEKGSTPTACSNLEPSPNALADSPPPQIGDQVSTLAGGSTAGYVNSSDGLSARFNYPNGIASNADGDLFVADVNNHRIRKVTQSGEVTLFAGSGANGRADGTAETATFSYPSGIAVNQTTGDVYVSSGQAIRKITPAGVVTTFAGSTIGATGFVNGTGTAARFFSPIGMTIDSEGNLYVADVNNNAIRKITPAGVVTTFAGSGSQGSVDGTGTAAQFRSPRDVAVDSDDNIFVVDYMNNTIRKITPAGVVTTLAGTAGSNGYVDGNGATARFTYPTSIAIDANDIIFVADTSRQVIRKITQTGDVTTLAGTPGSTGYQDGVGSAARFTNPQGLTTFEAKLFVIDNTNNRIRVVQ